MKIVKFKGGLGNQIFQYSFLRLLQLQHKCDKVKADFSYYKLIENDNIRKPRIQELDIIYDEVNEKNLKDILMFNNKTVPHTFFSKVKTLLEGYLNSNYYLEKNREYINPEKILKYDYFDGYWQSWKYIDTIKDILVKELKPLKPLSDKTEKLINQIYQENSVFLGIRRGDYLKNKKYRQHYGTFSQDYFDKAFQIINMKIKNPIIYVFSNDIDWVKENIDIPFDCVYREKECQTSDLEELFIMSSCKHAIIVNSTFYWWGAWLIQNDDKLIIAPKKWFHDKKKNDIVPETWIKI